MVRLKNSSARILTRVLLLPVMPCFMWGPFTHVEINRRVLGRLESERAERPCVDLARAVLRHKDVFIYSANSADAIASNHVLKNVIVYDFAHNNIPNEPAGSPIFGHRMVDTALERLEQASSAGDAWRCERDLAFACGWLSHQLADRAPHYLAVKRANRTFQGYANSHQILTPVFHEDLLYTKEPVEHGLIELFHDAYVVARDRSGYLSPGKNHVELITDSPSNLVEAVSSSFSQQGFSKIPAEHLASLKDDYNLVIRGLDALIVLLRCLQPNFDAVIEEFIEDDRDLLVDRSVDDVWSGLFLLKRDEIHRRAWQVPRTGRRSASDDTRPGKIIVSDARDESILLRLAFQLAPFINPAAIAVACADGPMIEIPLRKPFSYLVHGVKVGRESIRAAILPRLERIGGKSEATRAVARFFNVLLSESNHALEKARDEYCRGLRPIASLDCDRDTMMTHTEDEILTCMYRERVFRIRFTPAVRLDRDSPGYLLNPDTVSIRINGYLAGDTGASFTVRCCDPTAQVLRYEVRLHDDFDPEEFAIFADVHDYRGEHSQYISKQVRVG